MWLSRQTVPTRRSAAADRGVVTIGGSMPAVYSGVERRSVPVYGPGGYFWQPARGDGVLILKTGAEGEAPCVLGRAMDPETVPAAGEILITNGSASVRLGRDGKLYLTGELMLNGQRFPPEGA